MEAGDTFVTLLSEQTRTVGAFDAADLGDLGEGDQGLCHQCGGGETYFDRQDSEAKDRQRSIYNHYFGGQVENCQAYRNLLELGGSAGSSPDESLGLRPQKLVSLWTLGRLFSFGMVVVRGALNIFEATKLVINLQAFWNEHYSEGTIMGFLQERRRLWISAIVIFECVVLWYMFACWFLAVSRFLCGKLTGVKVLVDHPKMIANFSVLQLAMFINIEIFFDSFNTYWKAKLMVILWEFRTGRGRDSQKAPGKLTEACCKFLQYVIWPLAWMFVVSVSFVAFLSKMSFEVGDIVFKDTTQEWTIDNYTNFFAFINNCAGIIDWDRWSRNRLLLFRFGGVDSQWAPREMALMWKWYRMLAVFLVLYLESRLSALLVLSTLTCKDLQFLLVEEGERQSSQPQAWMYEDLERSLNDEEEVAWQALEPRSDQDDCGSE